MPPPMQRFGGGPNSLASHYQQYPTHSQGHAAGLPPPSLSSNPSFMNANSMSNAFSVNGNALSLAGGFSGPGLGMTGGTGLASQAAQMSFAGASIHHQHNGMGEPGPRVTGNKNRIRDVWAGNLHEEMALLRQLVDKYPYIAMDTEFPGVVARPMGSFRNKTDYHYQCMRCNVDLLKILQLGITIFSEAGESPPATVSASDFFDTTSSDMRKYAGQMMQLPTTWQFNFKFNLQEDMYSEVSIEALKQAGVDFPRLETEGIDPFQFGALLMTSGLVCFEEVHWISFHGGYDFGYLTKILYAQPLADDEEIFAQTMENYFPSIYDIKYLMKHACKLNNMGQLTPLDPANAEVLAKFEQKSGLESLADSLKVKRQGVAHSAGSDSLLTGKVFFRMRERIFNGEISDEHLGKVWGLGVPDNSQQPANIHSTPQHYNQTLQENVTPNQNGYANGAPSTPNTGRAALVSTPSHGGTNGGTLTPGGVGGVFGNFQYSSK